MIKDSQPRKPDTSFQILSVGVAVVLAAFVGVICYFSEREVGERAWIYSFFILGMPLLQIPFVILMLRKNEDLWGKNMLLLYSALVVEVILLGVFGARELPLAKKLLSNASIVGLLSALGLGAFVFWITSLIMGLSDGKGAKYKELLRREPFLNICFFLTIFTLITVFLSLSMALHDQDLRLNHSRCALYAEAMGPSAKDGDDDTPGVRKDEQENDVQPEAFRFLFAEGSATVELDSNPPVDTPQPNDKDSPESAAADEPLNVTNNETFGKVFTAIEKHAANGPVRVVLAGHSDDVKVNAESISYKTNFELSQARVNQTMVEMLSVLKQRNQPDLESKIEWILLPSGAEKSFLDPKIKEEERRSVEVALLPGGGGKDLHLLDYIYFMVYTITTTGYGDIQPISSYAKFLTSVANFFEVFLIVVFFNALLSFLRENNGASKKSGEAPSPT